jgi:hypothetical protein
MITRIGRHRHQVRHHRAEEERGHKAQGGKLAGRCRKRAGERQQAKQRRADEDDVTAAEAVGERRHRVGTKPEPDGLKYEDRCHRGQRHTEVLRQRRHQIADHEHIVAVHRHNQRAQREDEDAISAESRAVEELADVKDDAAIRRAAHIFPPLRLPELPTPDRRWCPQGPKFDFKSRQAYQDAYQAP